MKRKIKQGNGLRGTLLFICLLMPVLPAAAAGPGQASPEPPAMVQGPADPDCDPAWKTQKLTFVHVGDLHANFELPEDKYSRIRAYYKETRKKNPFTLFTNAGDDHEKGSLAEHYTQGQVILEATAAMDFDVRNLGNHDFAWGEKHTLDFSRDARALVLASNTRYTGDDSGAFGGREFGILKVGCLRVGFFGMVGPPWNELNEFHEDDYFPAFHTSYDYADTARRLVEAHRGEVDVMVMLSHLKAGDDIRVTQAVPGIDLVLGGHSHGGPRLTKVGKTLVLQPDYYGESLTRVDMVVDLASRKVSSSKRSEQRVNRLTQVDPAVHQVIAALLAKYAPDARKPVAYLKSSQNSRETALLAAQAAIARHKADAALLDPGLGNFHHPLLLGRVTPQILVSFYSNERQKPGTPGWTSFYLAEVSGADLQAMRARQGKWVYSGPASPDPGGTYRLVLQKGAALNPGIFFPASVKLGAVSFLAEAWETMAAYGADRNAACLYMNTDKSIPGCIPRGLTANK